MESCIVGMLSLGKRLTVWVLGLQSQHVHRKPLFPPWELWGSNSASAWPAESTYQPLRFISWIHRSQHSAKHSVFNHLCFLYRFSVSSRSSHLCHFELPKSGTLLLYKAWNDITGFRRNVTCLGRFFNPTPCDRPWSGFEETTLKNRSTDTTWLPTQILRGGSALLNWPSQ